jgi:Mitochondrial carrier protein
MLPYEYDGLVDVFRRTMKHEGVRGLFKGLTPNLLKVVHSSLLIVGGAISIDHVSCLYQCLQNVSIELIEVAIQSRGGYQLLIQATNIRNN